MKDTIEARGGIEGLVHLQFYKQENTHVIRYSWMDPNELLRLCLRLASVWRLLRVLVGDILFEGACFLYSIP